MLLQIWLNCLINFIVLNIQIDLIQFYPRPLLNQISYYGKQYLNPRDYRGFKFGKYRTLLTT